MHDINSTSKGNTLHSLPCTVRTSIVQGSCNQWVGNYDLLEGFLDKRKVHGLFPCCGQDGSRAQGPQNLHRFIHIHITSE